MTRALILCLAILLSGCATIDMNRPPPSDFPKLAITEHYVSWDEMRRVCSAADSFGTISYGCTAYDLIRETCDIFVVADDRPIDTREDVAHERLHCVGYDHIGASTIQDAWQVVKQWREGVMK